MTNQPKLGAFSYKGCSKDLRKRVEALWLKDARKSNMNAELILQTLTKWYEGKLKYLYVDLREIAEINGENGGLR